MANYSTLAHTDPWIQNARNNLETAIFYISGEAPGIDTVPPTVEGFSPAPGSQISRYQALSFSVLDTDNDPALPSAFAIIAILVYFPGSGAYEVAHDGYAFAPSYSASTLSVISASNRTVTLRRQGGWPASPTIRVRVVDRGGNIDG